MTTNAINNHSSNLTLDSPLLISSGGTSESSFTTDGILVYDGSSLVNSAGPKINSSGYMTNTSQPIFSAYSGSSYNTLTGDDTIVQVILDTERFDVSSSFNTTTYEFVAPIAGKYLLIGKVGRWGLGTSIGVKVEIATTGTNTVSCSYVASMNPGNTGNCVSLVHNIFDMGLNDVATLKFAAFSGAKNVGYFAGSSKQDDTSLSGFLIG